MRKQAVFFLIVLGALVVSCSLPRAAATRIAPGTVVAVSTWAVSPAPTLTPLPSPSSTVTPLPQPTPTLPPDRISRHPGAVDFSFINPNPAVVRYDPNSENPFQIDYRSADLRGLDLSGVSPGDLDHAAFDSRTRWPAAERLPPGFDPVELLLLAENPGLGMRALHARGITGEGVGIAILDQVLLVDHREYKDRVRLYEEAPDVTGVWRQSSMHGAAVASIAVGQTVGVAPRADLYYIATGGCNSPAEVSQRDFTCLAQAVLRIVQINQGLPEGRKIRVLSMSIGWTPENRGYDQMQAAVEEAEAAGIFVVSSNLDELQGLGRTATADPDDFQSYLPGAFWANQFWSSSRLPFSLLVPMDARTAASPTGLGDYVFYGDGGLSWAIPYLAGTYALAAQVKPSLTPDEFLSVALQTGQTIRIEHAGRTYGLGRILDPAALVSALKE